LKRYNFNIHDFPAHALPLKGERWGMDLFHPQALKDVGIHVSKGLAAGAMAGATIDAFTAGLSLGAATLIGATAGGLWQSADRLGKRVLGRLKGYHELGVDNTVLELLALRQTGLVQALERRGHAAQAPIMLAPEPATDSQDKNKVPLLDLRAAKIATELDEARSQPSWSTLAGNYASSPRREQIVRALARKLEGVSLTT
ncbi:MAG: DUF3482 domain-containing protein, partial [Burkholderiaceae bacterium]